ncbi:MAG: pentapeptide repeat-containing protein [Beijerinckiaceae bacterium]
MGLFSRSSLDRLFSVNPWAGAFRDAISTVSRANGNAIGVNRVREIAASAEFVQARRDASIERVRLGGRALELWAAEMRDLCADSSEGVTAIAIRECAVVDVSGEAFARTVELAGVELPGDFRAANTRFAADVWCNAAVFGGKVDLRATAFGGVLNLEHARFADTADFSRVSFEARVEARHVTFEAAVSFAEACFAGDIWARPAEFGGAADFTKVDFAGEAGFGQSRFAGRADFSGAVFHGGAGFDSCRFEGPAGFQSARFEKAAWFQKARFEGPADFGRARFKGKLAFEGATAAEAAPGAREQIEALRAAMGEG